MRKKSVTSYLPACIAYDPFQVKTLSDVAYLLQHEIDLAEEDQDGCLSPEEIRECRKALARVRRAA